MLTFIEKQSFGLGGCRVVGASTAAPEGTYCAIQFVTSGSLSALASNSIVGATGITFPAGFVLYGPFTGLTTAAGTTVVVYTTSS
jgi:hypothetical protein